MGKSKMAELELELEQQLVEERLGVPPKPIGTVVAESGATLFVTANQKCTRTPPRPVGLNRIFEVFNIADSGQVITLHASWDAACLVPLAAVFPGQRRRFDGIPWRFLGLTRFAARQHGFGLPILGRGRF